MNIKEFITGKKTYFLAATALLSIATGWSEEKITDHEAINSAIIVLMAASLRSGISTEVKKANETIKKEIRIKEDESL